MQNIYPRKTKDKQGNGEISFRKKQKDHHVLCWRLVTGKEAALKNKMGGHGKLTFSKIYSVQERQEEWGLRLTCLHKVHLSSRRTPISFCPSCHLIQGMWLDLYIWGDVENDHPTSDAKPTVNIQIWLTVTGKNFQIK